MTIPEAIRALEQFVELRRKAAPSDEWEAGVADDGVYTKFAIGPGYRRRPLDKTPTTVLADARLIEFIGAAKFRDAVCVMLEFAKQEIDW